MKIDSIGIRFAFLITLIIVFMFAYINIEIYDHSIIVKLGLFIVGILGVFIIFMDMGKGRERKKKKH